MKNGTIENIFAYYLGSKKFRAEIKRAEREFFGLQEGSILLGSEEKANEFFMEWLIFDFKLANGRSLLEDYYYLNPYKLPLYKLQIYKDLQNNIYGLLEVQRVDQGMGLELLILHTGKKYYVREYSATFDLRKGNIFFGRVAGVGDHYELVGADSFKFDVHLDAAARKCFISKTARYSPKDAVKFLKENEDKYFPKDAADFSLAETIEEVDNIIKEVGIDEMVSARLIQKWLLKINFKNPGAVATILYNLTESECPSDQDNRLLNAVMRLINHSPQKALRGKAPSELREEAAFGSKGFSLSVIGKNWLQMINFAHDFFKEGEILKAFNEYNKAFASLLKEKITCRYIFSVYANLAVCYLYFGEEFMARKLLDTAIEINGNYKFAKDLIDKLDNHSQDHHLAESIRSILKYGRTKRVKQFKEQSKNYSDIELRKAYYDFSVDDYIFNWLYSPAKRYYDFLKKLEIDFSQVK